MPNHEPTPRWTIRRRLAVAAFSVLLAVISGVGNLLPGSSGTAPAEASPAQEPGVTRYFGRGAFEGIRRAVTDTPRSCDVSDDHLTAMVMAPIFKEVSMAETPDAVPSPMTLSRYDEWTGNRSGSNNLHANYGLYPFWDPHGTPFKRAFWHPGIGIFQYDSAGVGANFTAAERINTEFVTRDVVRGIADRYCAAGGSDAQRRAAAWQPWAVLGGVAKSEALFHEMVGAGVEPFSRIGLVDGVENAGGMEQRTCEVGGETVECFYVDPARAQGANWWATRNPDGGSVTSGESPLSAPFYVLRRGDFEERHWLAADTGYPIDLSARRLLGQNARPRDGEPQSGLQWFDSSDLCDTARPETGCPVPPPEEPEPAVEEASEENEQKGSEQADQGERRALRGKGDAAPAGDTARHAEIAVAADA